MARRPMEATPALPLHPDKEASVLPEWMAQVAHGVQPDQALALIGLGLMGRLGAENQSPWYTGAFFLKKKTDSLVVAEEKKRAIRSFVVPGL